MDCYLQTPINNFKKDISATDNRTYYHSIQEKRTKKLHGMTPIVGGFEFLTPIRKVFKD